VKKSLQMGLQDGDGLPVNVIDGGGKEKQTTDEPP
jgi:hypothetical protein